MIAKKKKKKKVGVWGARPQHPHPQFASVFHELSNNKRHSHFRTRSYKSDSYMFIMTSYRRKPFAAVKKRPGQKPVLNSPAKRRLKTFNNIAKIKHNNNNSTKGQNVSASHTKNNSQFFIKPKRYFSG